MWKICVTATLEDVQGELSVIMINGGIERKMETLSARGCEGVELLTLGKLGRSRYRELRELLEASGIAVCAVSSGAVRPLAGITLLEPQRRGEQVLSQLIDAGAELAAPVVTIGSFRGLTRGEPSEREYLRNCLRDAADHAAEKGVRLAIEPLNRYETDFIRNTQEALEFVNSVARENVGVLPDVFHMNIEEVSIQTAIDTCLREARLFHLHIADSNRSIPGRGHIAFHEIAQILAEGSYDGAVSGELERGQLAEEEAVSEYCGFMSRLRKGLSVSA